MSKVFYCSNCGTALEIKLIACKGDVVRVVAQHLCIDRPHDYDIKEDLDITQDMVPVEGKFVSKLNDLAKETIQVGIPEAEKKAANTIFDEVFGDNRPTDQIRDELPTSSAPPGLAKTLSPVIPANNIGDEPGEESEG